MRCKTLPDALWKTKYIISMKPLPPRSTKAYRPNRSFRVRPPNCTFRKLLRCASQDQMSDRDFCQINGTSSILNPNTKAALSARPLCWDSGVLPLIRVTGMKSLSSPPYFSSFSSLLLRVRNAVISSFSSGRVLMRARVIQLRGNQGFAFLASSSEVSRRLYNAALAAVQNQRMAVRAMPKFGWPYILRHIAEAAALLILHEQARRCPRRSVVCSLTPDPCCRWLLQRALSALFRFLRLPSWFLRPLPPSLVKVAASPSTRTKDKILHACGVFNEGHESSGQSCVSSTTTSISCFSYMAIEAAWRVGSLGINDFLAEFAFILCQVLLQRVGIRPWWSCTGCDLLDHIEEFGVAYAAVLDEGMDIVPVFLVILALVLEKPGTRRSATLRVM